MGSHLGGSGEIADKNKQEITMRHVLKSIGAFAILAMAAGGISQVAAHHSASMFDFSKSQTLKGKVVEVRWVNPHVTMTITGSTNPDEAPGDWLIETTSPGNLVRAGGWRRDALKPGDQVEVTFHPEREAGKKSGLLQEVKLVSTGEVFTSNIRDQEKPGLE
jgi:Family of unknown function (DUF6152)